VEVPYQKLSWALLAVSLDHAAAAILELHVLLAPAITRSVMPEAAEVVAELAASRSYARDALSDTPEEVVDGCVDALSLYGFCVIDHAIPPAVVEALRAECIAATPLIESMRREAGAKQRLTDHELHFLPLFAPHLGNPLVTAVARAVLDSHVRVAQLHVRHVPPDQEETGEPSNAAIMPSGRYKRGWHTDW
jgi:hypothetical protein